MFIYEGNINLCCFTVLGLLGEIEGTCFTCIKSEKIPHECYNIVGIQESVYEISMNLKQNVLGSNV